jgi:hypothetical protein
MTAFFIDSGDRVYLRDHVSVDLGGGFRVHGPDAGRVIEVSIGLDLVSIEWDRAQVRGWYEITKLASVATISKEARGNEGRQRGDPKPQRRGILTEAEMLRFQSIQQLLTRLGFLENQTMSCMYNPETYDTIAFSQIAGQSVTEFVRQGLAAGWLREYLKEE